MRNTVCANLKVSWCIIYSVILILFELHFDLSKYGFDDCSFKRSCFIEGRHRSSVKAKECEAMRGIALHFDTLLSLLE